LHQRLILTLHKEVAMRRFNDRAVAKLAFAAAIVGTFCTHAKAQNVPGYWAGDVSLAPTAEGNLNQPSRNESNNVAVPTITSSAPASSSAALAIPNQTRQALGFYGGQSALATLNSLPRNTIYQPAQFGSSQSSQNLSKPFQNAADRPTMSPYLNLFRDDKGSQGIPNYYAFVQPQLEQQSAGERQQIQSERRERQNRSARSAPAPQSGGTPQAGFSTSAHFMDTAQFYGAWRR
jgi:hypothetical protein